MGRKKKDSTKPTWGGMPTGATELTQIKAAVENTYDLYKEVEDAKAGIKEVFDDLNARTGIPRNVFNFLCKTNYFGTASEILSKNEQLAEAHEALQNVSL